MRKNTCIFWKTILPVIGSLCILSAVPAEEADPAEAAVTDVTAEEETDTADDTADEEDAAADDTADEEDAVADDTADEEDTVADDTADEEDTAPEEARSETDEKELLSTEENMDSSKPVTFMEGDFYGEVIEDEDDALKAVMSVITDLGGDEDTVLNPLDIRPNEDGMSVYSSDRSRENRRSQVLPSN